MNCSFQTNADRTARIMPIALLHSLLLQQCYYGNGIFQNNHHWSLTDVAMAVDMYKKVMYKCGKKEGVAELVSQIYTDHCVDQMDHTVVESLVRTLSKLSTMTAKEVNMYSKTCVKRSFKNRQNKDLKDRW